jgi:hypothetical protein
MLLVSDNFRTSKPHVVGGGGGGGGGGGVSSAVNQLLVVALVLTRLDYGNAAESSASPSLVPSAARGGLNPDQSPAHNRSDRVTDTRHFSLAASS